MGIRQSRGPTKRHGVAGRKIPHRRSPTRNGGYIVTPPPGQGEPYSAPNMARAMDIIQSRVIQAVSDCTIAPGRWDISGKQDGIVCRGVVVETYGGEAHKPWLVKIDGRKVYRSKDREPDEYERTPYVVRWYPPWGSYVIMARAGNTRGAWSKVIRLMREKAALPRGSVTAVPMGYWEIWYKDTKMVSRIGSVVE